MKRFYVKIWFFKGYFYSISEEAVLSDISSGKTNISENLYEACGQDDIDDFFHLYLFFLWMPKSYKCHVIFSLSGQHELDTQQT